MTKSEALQEMFGGKKITHRYFDTNEYIYMNDKGEIMTEDNCNFTEEFEVRRYKEPWLDGWSIKE